MKYLFLDTNIFLHYKIYNEIPWRKIINDDYKIVIAPIVLDELDKHKTNPNPKTAKRSKNILQKIEEDLINPDGIFFVSLTTPKEETFIKFNLSRTQQDHALLCAILELGEINGLENIIFITHDTGPRLRARQLGINAMDLDEEYIIPNEDTEEQKELKKLRLENAQLKNNLPKLELQFDDGMFFKEVKLQPFSQTESEYYDKELNIIKEQYPLFHINDTEEDNIYPNRPIKFEELVNYQNRINSLFNYRQPTIEQRKEYNDKINLFYSEYSDLIKKKYKYDIAKATAVLINLIISNIGTAPAKDIDIYLIFPENVNVLLFKDFPKFEKPIPPYKPKYIGDTDTSIFRMEYLMHPRPVEYIRIIDDSIIKDKLKCYNKDISTNKGTILHFKYSDSLKHNLQIQLEPIWILCKKSFQIKSELLIANYPNKVEKALNIKIHLDEE